jgi:3'-phosphoadenosine 5'-phosphosulfate sulfotransferase (PAPS reductase)/FAD synthetase
MTICDKLRPLIYSSAAVLTTGKDPLFDWSRDHVWDFLREHNVPYNVLFDRSFLSVGCAPCTRGVGPGESERSGRWWWEEAGMSNRLQARPLCLP